MKRRSFRVSENFLLKLEYLQQQSKLDEIPKTQEQLLDEMINLYFLYKTEDTNLFITEEMHKQLTSINNIYITKQAQLINAVLEHIDTKIDELNK